MNVGTWTAAYLLLTLAAGTSQAHPDDVWPVPKNRFEIPIKVDPARRAEIRELQLYCSNDHGNTWIQVGAATPEHTGFPFTAQVDGEYWFTVVVVDQQNRRDPPNVQKA